MRSEAKQVLWGYLRPINPRLFPFLFFSVIQIYIYISFNYVFIYLIKQHLQLLRTAGRNTGARQKIFTLSASTTTEIFSHSIFYTTAQKRVNLSSKDRLSHHCRSLQCTITLIHAICLCDKMSHSKCIITTKITIQLLRLAVSKFILIKSFSISWFDIHWQKILLAMQQCIHGTDTRQSSFSPSIS